MCIPTTRKGAEMRNCYQMGTFGLSEGLGDTYTGDDELLYRWEEYRW